MAYQPAPGHEHCPPPPEPYEVDCERYRSSAKAVLMYKPREMTPGGRTIDLHGWMIELEWTDGYSMRYLYDRKEDAEVLWDARYCKMKKVYMPAQNRYRYEPDEDCRRQMAFIQADQRRQAEEARIAAETEARRLEDIRRIQRLRRREERNAKKRSQGGSRSATATRASGRSTNSHPSGPFRPPSRPYRWAYNECAEKEEVADPWSRYADKLCFVSNIGKHYSRELESPCRY